MLNVGSNDWVAPSTLGTPVSRLKVSLLIAQRKHRGTTRGEMFLFSDTMELAEKCGSMSEGNS